MPDASQNSQLPQGWRWVKLGNVARVFSGSSAPQGNDFFCESGKPFVRVSDLSNCNAKGVIEKTRDYLSEKALSECSLVNAPKDTIVFPKSGAAIATNKRAILGMDAFIVGHLIALTAKPEMVMMKWLYFAMRQIDMMEHSDNTGYPSLKKSVVEDIEIPIPSLAEQRRIVGVLEEKMAAVEKARTAAEAELEAIAALPSALLRQAFNGAL